MKEKLYNLITESGIWFLQKMFPDYYAKDPLSPTDRYYEYPFVLKFLPKRHIRILDVGCSGSLFPLMMKSLGHDVWGIDIRNYCPENEINFVKEDICFNSFPNENFDIVTAVSSIEHIGLKGRYGAKETSTDHRAVHEIHRILRPNGMLLMTVPFGIPKILKTHKVYDKRELDVLLRNFYYQHKVIKSPEQGNIALIVGIK